MNDTLSHPDDLPEHVIPAVIRRAFTDTDRALVYAMTAFKPDAAGGQSFARLDIRDSREIHSILGDLLNLHERVARLVSESTDATDAEGRQR